MCSQQLSSHQHSSDTIVVWKRKMNRKLWKWEKIKREESYVILATLWLCSPITASLCIPHRIKQWGMRHTPADGRPAKTMAVHTRLKRCSSFFLSEIHSEICILSPVLEGCWEGRAYSVPYYLSPILHLSYNFTETFLLHLWARIHKSNTFKLVL